MINNFGQVLYTIPHSSGNFTFLLAQIAILSICFLKDDHFHSSTHSTDNLIKNPPFLRYHFQPYQYLHPAASSLLLHLKKSLCSYKIPNPPLEFSTPITHTFQRTLISSLNLISSLAFMEKKKIGVFCIVSLSCQMQSSAYLYLAYVPNH